MCSQSCFASCSTPLCESPHHELVAQETPPYLCASHSICPWCPSLRTMQQPAREAKRLYSNWAHGPVSEDRPGSVQSFDILSRRLYPGFCPDVSEWQRCLSRGQSAIWSMWKIFPFAPTQDSRIVTHSFCWVVESRILL